MEVKIGIQNSPRELTVNVDGSADEVTESIRKAVADSDAVLTLTDTKGRTLLVPTQALAYVELGSPSAGTVGFRS